MIRIADLLASYFSEPIELSGDHLDVVFTELTSYFATSHIREAYERLLSAMTAALKSPDENVGIWISGPLGSGKSSFVKNLGHAIGNGYALGNRVVHGTRATALFLSQVESKLVTECVESLNRSSPCEIFPVNLRAERAVEAHAEHIAEAMYRALLRTLDYAEDYDISELEMELEKEGKLVSFEDLCRTEYHKEWRDIRKAGQRLTCASLLLHRLAPQTYASADAWWNAIQVRPSLRPSTKDLVERAFELCEVRRPGNTFAFILDEIGPYAALGPERIENLRAVVEQFGRESLQRLKVGKIPGPIWIIVAAREKLHEVSDHLAASRIARAKLTEQFKYHVELSPEDIREVVAHRVLRKRESAEPVLRKLFRDSSASLIQNVKLERCSRRSESDEDQFVRFYPYLPHLMDLWMEIIAGIRLHPNRPRLLGRRDRNILEHFHDMLWSGPTRFADQPVGALVSIDKIYDLVEANIPPAKRKQIRQARQRLDDGEDYQGMAGRVAKAICLMEFVKADLPRTTKNIAALLIQNVSEEPPSLAVAKILHELKDRQFVRETEDGWTLYDFHELRRRTAALRDLMNAVGVVNPRPPGWHNELIQLVKKVLARFLSWYTRPLYEFNASVSRSLEGTVQAVDHLTTSLEALDRLAMKQAFEHLPVDLVELEEQLAQLDQPGAPVAQSMQERVALLHQQVKVLADMQKSVDIGSRFPIDNGEGSDQRSGQERHGMPGRDHECKDRTTYIIGLFGTGRRYINELILQNIGERAEYFRDTIRLHPGPTPMIYSGHVTTKYPSRAQEAPAIMRYIMESVRSGFSDLIFLQRHPLDSLLTNWVWWRTYIRENRAISGISEIYKNTDGLCADLEDNFPEFEAFAAGDPKFFAASPGPRFLSFAEFVEETELHLESSPLALRLEDFMIDPRKEFSKILDVMSVDLDLGRLSLPPPRTKPNGYLAVREHLPQFRNFIDGLDAETKKRIERIGYQIS